MAETTVNLGFLPKNRGEYQSNTRYYKDNIVQYNGSSYISDPVGYSDSDPTATYTTIALTDSKGNNFGKTFDTIHDGTITSQKGFGGYYYLYGVQDTPYIISNGGGFDHAYRSNILTNMAWQGISKRWYLYGARLMFKNIYPN